MTGSVKEIIKKRRSVRTFDGNPITEEDRRALEEYLHALTNPFGIPVEFALFEAKEHKLTSPVIVGEHTYLAAKIKTEDQFELAFGYSFEKACLYALSRGIGTVMLASTLSRDTFEQALELKENEVMPVASPVGYPAEKMSIRESVMRKGIKADERKAFEDLFFDGSFDKPLAADPDSEDDQYHAAVRTALEMVRLAPSAVNKQPWRVMIDGEKVYFYEVRTLDKRPTGDIQKVDMGIALAHFDVTMEEEGYRGRFITDDPRIESPEGAEYIVTYEPQEVHDGI